jgi:hypothetical protein
MSLSLKCNAKGSADSKIFITSVGAILTSVCEFGSGRMSLGTAPRDCFRRSWILGLYRKLRADEIVVATEHIMAGPFGPWGQEARPETR